MDTNDFFGSEKRSDHAIHCALNMLASIAISPIRSCPAGGGGGGGDTPVNSWWECAAQFSKS